MSNTTFREVLQKLQEQRAAARAAGLLPEPQAVPEPHYECDRCQDKGAYPVEEDGEVRYQFCECRDWKRQRRLVEQARAQLQADFGVLGGLTFEAFKLNRMLPGSVRWCGYEMPPEQQRDMLEAAIERCQQYAYQEPMSGFLWLGGTYGSGKTHLAAAVAQHAVERGLMVRFFIAPRLFGYIREGYGYEGNQAERRVDELSTVDVLWLDDLGTQKLTEFVEEMLYCIVDERMRHRRPTIFTSNLRIEDMPGRIASRIIGNAQQVWLVAEDYRRVPR